MAKLPCPPELWPEFSALLDEALELPDHSRQQWLAGLGPEHAEVHPWLHKVIARGGATLTTDFMRGPAPIGPGPAEPDASEFRAGQRIGRYLLQRRLGSGGMGEVWLALLSDGTLHRQVALKLPHANLLADALRRRFERERDILAGLSHPHIAQLYDTGVADDRHPYLAMEWVDGESLTDHCVTVRASLPRRLDLFLQILDAVGHAHGRLIAHRDLKPSNILVTRDESVKLLDFGIAKLLTGDTEGAKTALTRVGNCIATPGYAAPEQLAGEPITAAVDIYALGVVLHELLTGVRPYSGRRGGSPTAAVPDLVRPSARIDPAHAATVSGLDGKGLRRALSGDLDAIIAKALETDPARRYQTADAFAQDLRRSRDHRPISARHISPATLTLKFVRRHRVGVALSAWLLLALVGGSAGIAWQGVRAAREAQRATLIKDFLIGMFRASDPRIPADKPRGSITAKELLDATTSQIESGFAHQPDTQLELLGVAADIYRELDETTRSSQLYAREAELGARVRGPASPFAIEGLLGQADNADTDGDDARALALLARADPLLHKARLDHSPLRAHWLLFRGESLFGDPSQSAASQASLTAAKDLFKAVAPGDPRYADALIDLGSMAGQHSDYPAAAAYYDQALSVSRTNSQLAGSMLLAYGGLAMALRRLGDFDGAAKAFNDGTAVASRTYGHSSHQYWMIASDRAQFHYERGEREAALTEFDTLLGSLSGDREEYANATEAAEAAQVLRKYGYCLAEDGQGARALVLLEHARGLLQKSAARAFDQGRLQLDLGRAFAAAGRVSEADEAFRSALDTLRTRHAPELSLAYALADRGSFFLSQKDIAAAAADFHEAQRLAPSLTSEPAVHAEAGLATLAVLGGDAVMALAASERALERFAQIDGYFDVRLGVQVWEARARALLLGGDLTAGRALALRARDAAQRNYAPDSPTVRGLNELLRVASLTAAQQLRGD